MQLHPSRFIARQFVFVKSHSGLCVGAPLGWEGFNLSRQELSVPDKMRDSGGMLVLVLASQKGGSGKTTLSGHLAVEADRAGVGPVALIDTDPQGSLSQWWNAREASTPYFAQVGILELGDALEHLKKSGVRLAVIDTPPAITASISRVVAHADLVLVPTRPSPHDLRAVGATVDIAEKHGKPLIFVVNGATARARITGEAAVALSQHGTVAPVTLHHRVDFAASMTDGRTVGEVVAKSQSAKEVRDLWLYVQDRLSRLSHDPKLMPETRPDHFAVGALSFADETEAADDAPGWAPPVMTENLPLPSLAPVSSADVPPPMPEKPPFPDGIDRRMGSDRRAERDHIPGSDVRRNQAFGRRAADRLPLETGSNR
jgi:chromosome partitioning protein